MSGSRSPRRSTWWCTWPGSAMDAGSCSTSAPWRGRPAANPSSARCSRSSAAEGLQRAGSCRPAGCRASWACSPRGGSPCRRRCSIRDRMSRRRSRIDPVPARHFRNRFPRRRRRTSCGSRSRWGTREPGGSVRDPRRVGDRDGGVGPRRDRSPANPRTRRCAAGTVPGAETAGCSLDPGGRARRGHLRRGGSRRAWMDPVAPLGAPGGARRTAARGRDGWDRRRAAGRHVAGPGALVRGRRGGAPGRRRAGGGRRTRGAGNAARPIVGDVGPVRAGRRRPPRGERPAAAAPRGGKRPRGARGGGPHPAAAGLGGPGPAIHDRPGQALRRDPGAAPGRVLPVHVRGVPPRGHARAPHAARGDVRGRRAAAGRGGVPVDPASAAGGAVEVGGAEILGGAALAAAAASATALAVGWRLEPVVAERMFAGAPAGQSRTAGPGVAARLGARSWLLRVARPAMLHERFAAAGLAGDVHAYVGRKALVAAATLTVSLVGPSPLPLLGPVLAAAGFVVPDMVLGRLARRRRAGMAAQLPQFLDLLAAGSTAGLSALLALRRATEAMRDPLAAELRGVLARVDLGARWRDELRAMAERLGLPELGRSVMAMARTESLGTPLAEALRQRADEVREAPVKMLFPLVFMVLPAFLLLTVVPVLLSTLRSVR